MKKAGMLFFLLFLVILTAGIVFAQDGDNESTQTSDAGTAETVSTDTDTTEPPATEETETAGETVEESTTTETSEETPEDVEEVTEVVDGEMEACGDGECGPGEDDYNCPEDCAPHDVLICGDGRCEGPENKGGSSECIEDCGNDCDGDGIKEAWECEYRPEKECPVDDVCPDGVTHPCREEDGQCICEPCPLPENCWEERDESGFSHIVCESEERPPCPEIPPEAKEKCVEDGGRVVIRTDHRGCEYADCEFSEERQIFERVERCPTREDIDEALNSCGSMGMRGVIVRRDECKFVKCIHPEEEEECPPVTRGVKEGIFEKCERMGRRVVEEWDDRGCVFLKCAGEGECFRLPPEAFRKCEKGGGELIVRDDEHGCVTFHKCVMPGDESDVYVERMERVPETSELLSIAFKLEELKIEFDKLARKTNQIADYYAFAESLEEARFRRVSDMFNSAKGKVDEIKNNLRDRLRDITIDDLMDIKHDIRYIKDVILKDILYYMLSTSEEVQELVQPGENDCGTDGRCFDRAFRVCKPIVFFPEGRRGPKIEIKGLEGEHCIMYAVLPEGEGPPAGIIPGLNPPYEMTCRIKDYSMGMRGPEDIMDKCEGSMVTLMKTFGTRGEGREPEFERERFEREYRAGEGFKEKYEYERERFEPEPREFEEEPGFEEEGFEKEPCSGCLDNGICDPGECMDCPDCMR